MRVRLYKIAFLITFIAFFFPAILFAASTSSFRLEILPVIPPGGIPNGPGGGSGVTSPATLIFTGKAYPGREVFLLKDGQMIDQKKASVDADFRFSLSALDPGVYTFSIYSFDDVGVQSVPYTISLTLGEGTNTTIADIILPPTIVLDKTEVEPSIPILVSGQTIPNGEVAIYFHGDVFRTPTDLTGHYQLSLITEGLPVGLYDVTSKVTGSGYLSTVGSTVVFRIGEHTIPAVVDGCPQKADLNDDCRVNIVDFSIAAYWYGRELSNSFLLNEEIELNGDGLVDLRDFSIIAFYWTG